MADESLSNDHLQHMLDLVKSTEEVDVLKETCEWLINELMKQDVTEQIDAEPHEQTEDRETYRNGYRDRVLKTRVGALELRIPKLRDGTYYPDWLLERQQPAEQAVIGTVLQAYINGVSTRKVTNLVEEMGLEEMDKSEVSRINQQLDGKVKSFQTRQFDQRFPYVYLDGTVTKVRENGQVLNTTLVVAVGISETGHREILGFDIGGTEDEAFWMRFLKDLKQRGLTGTRLIISDAHVGLRNAINTVFTGTAWQRCLAHYKNNIAVDVPSSLEDEAKAWIDSIVNVPNEEEARHQIDRAMSWFEEHDASRAAKKLHEEKDDLLAHMRFPKAHWKRLRTINSVERLNREVKRRFDVVGVFPDRDAILRLGGSYLMQQHDSWISSKRYFNEESMQQLMENYEETKSNVVKIN
jgi:transposase-like protein